MTEMIEMVALAISGSDDPANILSIHRVRARAAIMAMREPTETMIEAGRETTCEHGDIQCGCYESWQAMIDVALTQ